MQYPSRYKFAPMLYTSATVSVGRGVERHRLTIVIRPSSDGTLRAGAGQTYCGSQRAMSGWHSLSFDGAVTCERCLRRDVRDDAPAVDVIEVKNGRLTVKTGVEIVGGTR